MRKITKEIMESFKQLLPEDKTSVVEEAIEQFVQQVDDKYKSEYEKTLEESYKEWDVQLQEAKQNSSKLLKETESVAYQGYEEAKQMLEAKEQEALTQKQEFESFLEEQYEIAKQMLEEEKAKNEQLEQSLYESYTQQVEDLKEDLVEKIDSFLSEKVDTIAESVRKELKNSPEILENKIAFERIKDIVSSHMSPSDLTQHASEKVDSLEESVARLEGELKVLKAKNMRLVTESQNYQKNSVSSKYLDLKESTNSAHDEFDSLNAPEMDSFASMIKGHLNKKVQDSYAYRSKKNEEFFFWADYDFLLQSNLISKDNTYGTGDIFGICRKVVENYTEVKKEFAMVLKLDNGKYRYYSNNRSEDFVNPVDAIMKFMENMEISENSRNIYRKLAERNAMNVEGRGSIVNVNDLITENAADKKVDKNEAQMNEDFGFTSLEDVKKLAGFKK